MPAKTATESEHNPQDTGVGHTSCVFQQGRPQMARSVRHTWASLMRQSGVSLSDLRELGGWESHQMVDRYAHLNVEHLAPKAAVLDGVLMV